MPSSRRRKRTPQRRVVMPKGTPPRSPIAQTVDAQVSEIRAAVRGQPEELRPVLAEASAAHFVGITDAMFDDEDGSRDPTLPARFWDDLAEELERRGDEHSAALLAALSRLAEPEFRPALLRALARHGPARDRWVLRVGAARLTRRVISGDTTRDGGSSSRRATR
jgi:hypothetical protein